MIPHALLAASLQVTQLPSPIGPQSDRALAIPRHPNVLVVLVDDWGMDMLEIYGTPLPPDPCVTRPPTPHIDSLVARGVTFLNAWVMPTCSPTRASLLTGRLPYRTKIGQIVDRCTPPACPSTHELLASEFTLPELLGAASQSGAIPRYATAAIGKWHLGPDPLAPLEQGFDRFRGSQSNLGLPSNPSETFCAWVKNSDGVLSATSVYATTDSVDESLAFIGAQGSDPWFLYLALNAGHSPFHVPPAGLAPSYFQDDGSGGCVHAQSATCPPLPAGCAPPSCPPAPCSIACQLPLTLPPLEQSKARRPYYEAMIEALDTELGRLLAGVSLDDTIVFLLGDNGTPGTVVAPPFLGDRALGIPSKAKDSLYQGGINVPFIVAGAGVRGADAGQAPRTTQSLVHVVDLFATIAGEVGIDGSTLSTLAPNPLDSRSFRHVLRGRQGPGRATLFSEQFAPNFPSATAACELEVSRALRNVRFKLIDLPDPVDCNAPRIELLFDLWNDPYEEQDLIALGLHVVPGLARDQYQALRAELDLVPLP